MKPSLLSLIFLGSLGVAACREQPRAVAPASPSAPTSPSKSVPKIVAFGDSLTAGLGLSRSESYPALLQKRLDAEGFQYEVVNAGISGDTTAGGLRRVDWALEGDVRVVILELGANDILRGQSIEEMKKNLAQIIERIKARGVVVLLAGMEAPTNSGREYGKGVHEAFETLAREQRVVLIPFLLEGVAGIPSLNQGDGIHPNAEGTRLVADTVYRFIRPLIQGEKPNSAALRPPKGYEV
ncbi:MAG TPA: arylesterase [Blastocatellia bacterium]|nr:arylesterase [Blastocatellia bacterium]